MTVLEFIEELKKIEVKIDSISALYHRFVYEFENSTANYDKKAVYSILQRLSEEDFASLGIKLGRCFSDCQKERKILSSTNEGVYAQNLGRVEKLIEDLVSLYNEVAQSSSTKQDNTTTTILQHEEYLKEVKGKLKDLNIAINKANKLIDDKIFTLLINTVAILGIFVAIAFAGFGVTTIFSSIDFAEAFSSKENLIKSVLFLFLIALLSYNMLLILVYFIYKLSRPLIIRMTKDENGNELEESFSGTMNLTPFLIADLAIACLTVILFIWCQFI